MVSPTQLCWIYHRLPLRQRHVVFPLRSHHWHWDIKPEQQPWRTRVNWWPRPDIITTTNQKQALRWRHNGRDSVSNTSLTVVYSTVYSDADQRKHQSSASLPFVWGIHRGPVNSPHIWPVTRKCFHLMTSSWDKTVHIYGTYYICTTGTNHHIQPKSRWKDARTCRMHPVAVTRH